MKNKTKKSQPIYSDSFKLGVIARIVNGEISKEGDRQLYAIGGNSLILEWMRKSGYYNRFTKLDNEIKQLKKEKRKGGNLKQPQYTLMLCVQYVHLVHVNN
jgi:hypothetical protein